MIWFNVLIGFMIVVFLVIVLCALYFYNRAENLRHRGATEWEARREENAGTDLGHSAALVIIVIFVVMMVREVVFKGG